MQKINFIEFLNLPAQFSGPDIQCPTHHAMCNSAKVRIAKSLIIL